MAVPRTMGERVIHILPEQVASQIAAGEVVERPASAVKELVENALDAGARTVSVTIERGGAGLIAISDDGCGMGRADAVIALRRHATSKIRGAADLHAIATLGFRGEALAAIASVARLSLVTRRPADAEGVEIVATGGEIEAVRMAAIAPGTRIEVHDLFFNTPARLKFLKTPATEQAAAAEAIQRLALANHRVAFSLTADGRTIYDLPRAANLRERMRQLFGAKLAARMLEFDYRENGMRAWGLAADSQESFATPRMVFGFVNGRAVRDRMIARAVALGYQTLLPRGRHPAMALFVELSPAEVDVNVHPMKTEVRFRRSNGVFELVYHALRARLADQTVDGPTPAGGAAQSSGDPNGANGDNVLGAAVSGPSAPAPAPADSIEIVSPGMLSGSPAIAPERRLRLVADAPAAARATQRPLGLGWGRSGAQAAVETFPDAAGSGAAIAKPLPRYSELRILGQLFAGYIALEHDEGLILVDQHAAHERVTFERLRAEQRAGGILIQPMLTPAALELSPARAAQVLAGIAELAAIGFEVEPFGPATILLKGAPAVFGAAAGLRLLGDLIDALGEGGFKAHGAGALEELLKQLACHGSVRVGRTLSHDEIVALLAALDATEFKSNCPHGRPVHIRFARGQIERLFRR
jgi:DNA mismatch repair protein MutL